MDEDNAKAALAASMKINPEQLDGVLAKLKEVLATNTVRDVHTVSTRARFADFIDTRRYFYIRMNQFETVVDSRDVKDGSSKDEVLTQTLDNKTQAWYFAGYRGDDNLETVVEEWTHSQHVDWLRR